MTVSFRRQHDVLINAPAEVIYDIVSNPQRPSEPSPDQVRCIDEDIVAGLAGLKQYVEGRMRGRTA